MFWPKCVGVLITGILLFPPAFAQDANSPSRQPVLDITSMDKTIDPCVDFYTYACGNWMKKNPVPPDESSWGAYSKLQDENLLQLRGILETAANPSADRSPVQQKIGDYYASCVDEKAVEEAGVSPLNKPLQKIDSLHSKRDLAELVGQMVDEGVLFEFGSQQDFRDATQVIAGLDQGGLGLPDRDYYLKTDRKSVDLRKAYVTHVQKMLELLGDKPAVAAQDARTVMRIETALARGSLTRLERRDPKKLDHKMTTAKLVSLSPSFRWDRYFSEVGLGSLQSLNVQTPRFFQAMDATLKSESLANWKTYLRWHLVHANAMLLSTPFVNEAFDFYGKTLRGAEQLRPRWKRCVDYVDGDLGEALGHAYVEKYFSPAAKQNALKMVREIETAMEQDINSLSWMSGATKQRALQKLHTVVNKIGYPDHWRDYSRLEVVRGDAIGNATRAREFEFHRQLGKIGKPLDRGEWDMTPPTVNAEYNPQKNDINFPAGVLQPPLFDPASDAAPNYGNTGGTIGHELTHGFDDEGRQYDAQGNLRDWWTPSDAKAFEQRASCISTQYSGYTVVDDIKLNGKLTLGEDVADLGGLLLAYMAWKSDTQGQQLEPIENFTPDQRFFIGYAQSWCTNERDETRRLRATVDVHSPEKYRTNGVVSNMPQFQQAFHCKAGSPMVRANACRVW